MSIEPTELQKRAANNVIKQKMAGGKVNKGKAILEAGYAPSVAKAPQLVTESKGYRAYLEKHNLNEERVAGLMSEEFKALGAGERLPAIKVLAQMLGMFDNKIDLNVVRSDKGLDLLEQLIDGNRQNTDTGVK